jgi:sugar/nucleoside kinase (ribokinase family)
MDRASVHSKEPSVVIAGRITREYILPPFGKPLLDAPGGSALYAAGGLIVWEKDIGLLACVGEDYPRPWLKQIEAQGVDIAGIQILKQSLDLRAFHAYNEKLEITHGTPVSQFARRELTFPKALLGYQEPAETPKDARRIHVATPLPMEIPAEYHRPRAVHLCPLDFEIHNQLTTAFRAGPVTTLTLDPSADYMIPSFFRNLRIVLGGLTTFLPSEEELRRLFWGVTHDLWEMAEAVAEYGCEIVVVKRGGQGQAIFDVKGQHRWEVPAYPARPADPTGAGDAFCGGYLAGFSKTYDPLQAALYGNVSASLKVEGCGAFYPLEVLPGLAEARLSALKNLVREV